MNETSELKLRLEPNMVTEDELCSRGKTCCESQEHNGFRDGVAVGVDE